MIQTSDVGGTLGLIRMQVRGSGGTIADTCTGVVHFTAMPGPLELRVSQCNGTTGGQYTVSLNVVSDDGANCGRPLTCGATPEGVGFAKAGEVDSFMLSLTAGRTTSLRLNYTDVLGAPSLRLFGPDGEEMLLEGRCAGQVTIQPPTDGIYTALIGACGRPARHPYRIEFYDTACSQGPVITTFGVANSANEPEKPIGYDSAGRPIFSHAFGQGFSLILEVRAGANRHNPGLYPAPYYAGEDLHDPDMQMILSHPLGNGSPVVCDTMPPDIGVSATSPFLFPAPIDTVHDMGCRFIDGGAN